MATIRTRSTAPRVTRRAFCRAVLATTATAALAACGGVTPARGTPSAPAASTAARTGTPAAAAVPLAVAATTTQLQDFVRNVGGARVAVGGILKPNVDPHDYEPTVQDVQTIARAQIVFVHGIGLDAWIGKTIANANATAPVVTATAGIAPLAGDAKEPDGDPHVWFDPTLAQRMVTAVAEGLAAVDPAGAATYRQNARDYSAQLAQLDAQVRGIFDQVPAADRKLVTNHDAFRYLARHFGLTIVGAVIPSIADTAEPSARDINGLIDTIRAQHVKAIFAESSANPTVAQQVAQETGIKIVDNLYGDTLGPPGSDGDTYLKMLVADATTIANALA